jgi:hypothetical protein
MLIRMTNKIIAYFFTFLFWLFADALSAQVLKNNEIKFGLNEDASHYVKLTFANQTWVRWNQNNPGSVVGNASYSKPENESWDISLRRTRSQLIGQFTDRVFFYAQIGQNNFNYLSARKTGFFLHDAIGEYAFVPKKLSIGAGLTGWTGPARFASPSVGSIMGMDAPLFEQWNNDVADQFLRHFAIYAKGKLGKIDYRFALAKPMLTQNATVAIPAFSQNATYSQNPANPQLHGYVFYQFKDEEANLTPYTTGTYLGKKKVFNIGAGFVSQANAMWYRGTAGDTVSTAMHVFAVDIYYDSPVGTGGQALSAYLVFYNANMGPNFIRNLGVNNIASGVIASQASFSGAGNAFPMFGTGNTIAGQLGYKLKDDMLGKSGTLLPYFMLQYGNYNRLNNTMITWNLGLNWLLKGHNSKLTLDYQSRPVFNTNTQGNVVETNRKGMFVLQWAVGIF